MGVRQGTFLRVGCGAEILFVQPCPAEGIAGMTCECGAEFVRYDPSSCPQEVVASADSRASIAS